MVKIQKIKKYVAAGIIGVAALFLFSAAASAAEPACFETDGRDATAISCQEFARNLSFGDAQKLASSQPKNDYCYLGFKLVGDDYSKYQELDPAACAKFRTDSGVGDQAAPVDAGFAQRKQQAIGDKTCGDPKLDASGKPRGDYYTPVIDIGCVGKGNPIMDAAFAVIRFLSYGVGLVVIASIIYAGIQYTISRGDPKATAEAVNRIQSSVFALFLYIFGFALLNYLIPAGVLR